MSTSTGTRDLIRAALEHAKVAYAFAPNSYTHAAMTALRDAVRAEETETEPTETRREGIRE